MTTAQDVVGIFDAESFEQMFSAAVVMRLQLNPTSKVPQHPLETGETRIDTRISMPVDGQLLLIPNLDRVQPADIYGQIRTVYNSGKLFTIVCKAGTFENMFITGMPHDETPDMQDSLQIVLRVSEALFFKSQATAAAVTPKKPRATKNSSTAKRGEQAPRQSVAYQIFN
jgi:hypothetical protein